MDSTTRLLLQRPVAFHRVFAEVAGGAVGGLFLSQLYYWSGVTDDPEGWFARTQKQWWEETALSRSQQDLARQKLRQLGVLEDEVRGLPGTLHFRLNMDILDRLISQASTSFARKQDCQQSAKQESDNLSETNPQTDVENPQSSVSESDNPLTSIVNTNVKGTLTTVVGDGTSASLPYSSPASPTKNTGAASGGRKRRVDDKQAAKPLSACGRTHQQYLDDFLAHAHGGEMPVEYKGSLRILPALRQRYPLEVVLQFYDERKQSPYWRNRRLDLVFLAKDIPEWPGLEQAQRNYERQRDRDKLTLLPGGRDAEPSGRGGADASGVESAVRPADSRSAGGYVPERDDERIKQWLARLSSVPGRESAAATGG